MRKPIANTPCLMLLAPLFAITSVVYGVLFSRATLFDLGSFRWRPLWVGQEYAQIWPYRGDDWLMQSEKFNPNEYQVYPYVANGYFGQTLPAEGVGYWIQQNKSTAEKSWSINNWPLDEPRATFGTIAGFYDLQNRTNRIIWPPNLERGGESVISGIPNWTGLTITTETGESYLPGVDASNIREYLQSMSLRNGVVQTNTTWAPTRSDALFQINYTVLAHQREINLGLVSLDLMASKDVDITITDVLDGAGATRSTFRNKASEPESDLIWTSISPNGQDSVLAYEYSTVRLLTAQQTRKGDCEKASMHKLISPWISSNASTVAQSWCLSLRAGVPSTVYKYVGIASTDAFGGAAQVTARNAALRAKKMTWENLTWSHNEAWENLWESADIAVPGNKEVQKIARASLFHLLANLRPGEEGLGLGDNSISPSGLISDSYGGYIFWDADTWVAPSLFALHPDRAMNINNYRSKLHGQAKANIKANEFREFAGALYPWTSGRFGNCTGNGICAGYQYHINADIALAHWQYYLHTNDIEWLREKAWPIIFDAAEMFVDFVQFSLNYSQGTIWTFAITDPDEDAIQVNNGAYTNTAIKLLLGSWGPAAAELLNITIPAVWKTIAHDIPIPMNSDSDLIEEYTGMTGDIQIKQADVVLLSYPLDYAISTQIARNNLEYYAIRNSPFGPQMTWSAHSISESQLQIAGCASYTYLLYSIEPYIRFPFYQFSELIVDDASKNGGTEPAFPFLTGHGGYLQIFTHGLTGMRPRQDVLYLDPTLPPQLGNGGVQINGIKWRGVVLDVDIQLDHTTINCRKSLSQCSKDSCDRQIKVQIGENNPEAGYYYLSPEKSLIIPTRRPSFNSQGNHALCKPVSSNATYIAGQFPLSVVDGSPSSTWQPKSSSHVASLIIDLSSYIKGLSRVEIIWGAFPPVGFSVSLQNSHGAESNDPGSWEEVLTVNNVNISAPYEPERIKEVRMLERNRTVGVFGKSYDSRYVKLSIWGTQGLNKEAGATVAEFKISAFYWMQPHIYPTYENQPQISINYQNQLSGIRVAILGQYSKVF